MRPLYQPRGPQDGSFTPYTYSKGDGKQVQIPVGQNTPHSFVYSNPQGTLQEPLRKN